MRRDHGLGFFGRPGLGDAPEGGVEEGGQGDIIAEGKGGNGVLVLSRESRGEFGKDGFEGGTFEAPGFDEGEGLVGVRGGEGLNHQGAGFFGGQFGEEAGGVGAEEGDLLEIGAVLLGALLRVLNALEQGVRRGRRAGGRRRPGRAWRPAGRYRR